MPADGIAEIKGVTHDDLRSVTPPATQQERSPRETTERETRETTAQMLLPQVVQRELIHNPDLAKKLSEGQTAYVGVGTPDRPAHAFQFACYGLPPDAKALFNQRINKFFEEHPSAGFLTHIRSEAIKGMVTTMDAPLEQTLSQLDLLLGELGELKKTIGQQGNFALFLSEVPELRVGLYPMGENHAVLEAEQTAGLTMLSWAAKEAGNRSPENLHRLNWVSPEAIESFRARMAPDPRFPPGALGEPTNLSAPKEKGIDQAITMRPISPDASLTPEQEIEKLAKILEAEQPIIDHEGLTDAELTMLIEVSAAGFPAEFFIDRLKSDPNWAENLEENGFAEVKIAGEHVSLKFDYSGMSKLVSLGVDPQEFLKGLFGAFAGEVDAIMDKRQYLLGTEGDALILYIPADTSELKLEGLSQLVKVHSAIRRSYRQQLREGIRRGVLNGRLSEHEVGLKTYSAVSDEPISITFFKNGAFSIDDEGFDLHEDYGEKRAKQGGAGISIVIDEPLSADQEQEVFGANVFLVEPLHDGRYLYRIRNQSVLEESFGDALSGLQSINRRFTERMQALGSELDMRIWGRDKDALNLNTIENNSLEAAKWLYMLTQVESEYPNAHLIFIRQLRSQVSQKIGSWLESMWKQTHAATPADQSETSPVVIAYRMLQEHVPSVDNSDLSYSNSWFGEKIS